MRIGCYTVALNEDRFADRWAHTTRHADYVLVADTGSTDTTIQTLERHDVDVVPITVRPWRFDDARNAAMALLPDDLDVIIALDMDETLSPNWRTHIEQSWTAQTTRLRYKYVWSWTHQQQPDVIFFADKICGRFTHRWKSPVHEVLVPTVAETTATCDAVLIEHHPDRTKPRSQYLALLELAVREDPSDDRSAHYLGREYFFHARYRQAIDELTRHLGLTRAIWHAERSASMRLIAKCYDALNEPAQSRSWFTQATIEDPSSREALIDAARHALSQNDFFQTISYSQRVLSLPEYRTDYLAERYAMAEGAYDLMAVAYWHIKLPREAIDMAQRAIALNPHDQRLRDNLKMILGD